MLSIDAIVTFTGRRQQQQRQQPNGPKCEFSFSHEQFKLKIMQTKTGKRKKTATNTNYHRQAYIFNFGMANGNTTGFTCQYIQCDTQVILCGGFRAQLYFVKNSRLIELVLFVNSSPPLCPSHKSRHATVVQFYLVAMPWHTYSYSRNNAFLCCVSKHCAIVFKQRTSIFTCTSHVLHMLFGTPLPPVQTKNKIFTPN